MHAGNQDGDIQDTTVTGGTAPSPDPVQISLDQDWHSTETAGVLGAFATPAPGPSASERRARLGRFGHNKLPAPYKQGLVKRFLLQFHNVLIYVLLGASVVTFGLGHMTDTAVILGVVLVNAIIGFVQEGKAENAIAALHEMLAPHATVLAAGERQTVAAETLVPGDIVFLEAGEKCPADIRLLEARRLKVQEAILTGESVPVEKHTAPVAPDAALGDRSCMAFSGTMVVSGQAKGIVVATAASTQIGLISGMLAEVETLTTPLVRQMSVFAQWLTALILLSAALLLAYGFFVQHYEFEALFMVVVGLSVAVIPEGLPAVLTIALAIGVQAMARRNAIIRRMPAIETLGSVSVICTDKTGTLTRNEMMVATVITAGARYTVEGDGYEPVGDIRIDDVLSAANDRPLLSELSRAGILCNSSTLSKEGGGWAVQGDPMEGALLVLAHKVALDPAEERGEWQERDGIPFDSEHKYMASLHHNQDHGAVVSLKGAPEQILALCTLQRSKDGGSAALETSHWTALADEIARKGQRVLALAAKPMPADQAGLGPEGLDEGLIFLGLVGLIDPPRKEAVDAVSECRRAGIRVKMITGDHAGTAAAIAEQVGLERPGNVLTGADIEALDDALLSQEVMSTDVFARTSPEHKLRLVVALQSQGETVAMTGDGVNDAPALKRADAGIAMGQKGSEAAKETADLVLADDNFVSIAAAVREGRTVYDNLKKVISWTLPTNGGEAAVIVTALFLGTTLPISPVQILWVNLITAGTLGVALAFEATEENTMHRPPRPRHEPILDGSLVWHIALVSFLFLCGVFGIFTYALDRGYSVEVARTLSVNTLVVMEIFHLFFIRNIYGASLTWKAVRGTKVIWICVAIVTLGQFAFTYLPPLQTVFGTQAVSFADGLIVVGIGVALFAIIEIEKQIRLRLRPPSQTEQQPAG